MAKLVDTFAYDLLNPFKSIKTCLNNFSSVSFLNYAPSVNQNPYFEFNFTLAHPTHVRDIAIAFRCTMPTSLAPTLPAISSVAEIDSIGRRYENIEFQINDCHINTNTNLPTALNQFFMKRFPSEIDEAVFGRLYSDWRGFLYNYRGADIRSPMPGRPKDLYLPSRVFNGLIPLAFFCNFFAQDTVLPQNTKIFISFTYSVSPGFNLNFAITASDQFVFSNVAATTEGGTFDYSFIPQVVIKNRLVARENFHKIELAFKTKWREALPLTALDISTRTIPANVNDPRFFGKYSFNLNQIPEYLIIWCQLSNLKQFPSYGTNWQRNTYSTTFGSSAITGRWFGYNNGANSRETRWISLDVYKQFRNLIIDVNGTNILNYDYEESGLELDYYLKTDNEDFEHFLGDVYLTDSFLKSKIYFINLTNSNINSEIFSTLTSADITIQYTIIDQQLSQPANNITQLQIWYSRQVETSTDAYRRTWQN